ncbi:nucleoside-diphosphate sugar epimerase/dehydratase [Treponema sp. HNW]|uniref:polysaccharide biosynthesis protein n=1 Tax=Treponema sp. HNW TaxID=3116654 RepID=UPI003D09A3EC
MNRSEQFIYIIGAGFAGQMIAAEIGRKKIFGKTAAFIDDDPELIGKKIDGIPVLGPVDEFISFLRHADRDEAIIAMPSAPKERIKSIYESLSRAGFSRIKILPAISQIVDGTAHLIQAREIDPLDVLGRTPVTLSLKESLAYLRGKRVLITGAGGSIGSELARQLLSGGAQRLYLFGHGENSIYQIDKELHILQKEGVGEKAVIVPVIGDLKNREYMFYILSKLKADVIFHCAAYKHVPLMEENPVAVIENNVFGTKNLLDASLACGTERFVLISTDKAVEPVSVYGVSKMLCEKLVLQAAQTLRENNPDIQKKGAAYMFVRFGNVLGSRGSILPLFAEQLKTGGPLTVTHPEMKRYFMTIPEACSLVLKAGGVGSNATPYLLDMGEPIKIEEIARQFIRFSGLEPDKDVRISYIGLRPGERMEEPLWTQQEHPLQTEYPKILKLHPVCDDFPLHKILEKLYPICVAGTPNLYRSRSALLEILTETVPSLKESYNGNI